MQFLTSLFGGSGNLWLTAVFALGAVIVLILIVMWLLKLLTGATGRVGRGRNRRLSLIDSLSIDPKRQLLIIRRDDIEHLILTGGPSDVVIERGIHVPQPPVRTAPQAAAARRPGQTVSQSAKTTAAKPAAAAANPAPVVRPAAAQKVEPMPAATNPSNVSPLDRLREFSRPAQKRANPPKHPGLVRPVTPLERPGHPQPAENSANPERDSAKESGHERADGQGGFEGDSEQKKAEGRAGDAS